MKKKTRIPLRRHQEILLREASVRLITRLTADTLLETEEYKRISHPVDPALGKGNRRLLIS